MKKSDGYRQTEDGWYESLTSRDRAEYFFDSKSFDVCVDRLFELVCLFDEAESYMLENSSRVVDQRMVQEAFKKMVKSTPSLITLLCKSDNIVPHILDREAEISRRLHLILQEVDEQACPSYNIDEVI